MTTLAIQPTAAVDTHALSPSRARLWTGRGLSALVITALSLDTIMKVVQAAPAVEGTAKLGYPSGSVMLIGILEAICLVLYAYRRTAALGAVLLTGYLGGAVATHLRLDDPLFTHVLSPVYVAILAWGGLYLRDRRIGDLLRAAVRE
jgi:hypothetical protein